MPRRRRDSPRGISGLNEEKEPFDVAGVFRRLRVATKPLPRAALFELADTGYGSLFQVLVACIISIRTFDEVTVPTARALFDTAATPQAVRDLTPAQVDRLIHACTFHGNKARQIRDSRPSR